MSWVVLLTFVLGAGVVKEPLVRCPTWACVEDLRDHEWANPALVRLRVWEAGDYARVSVGGAAAAGPAIWPPVVDDGPT